MDTYDFLLNLIKEAGEYLSQRKQEHFAVGMKHQNPRDVVSELDVALGQFITDKIQVAYPDHAIYNEEAEMIDGNEYEWAIDPIDGTSSFVRGIPQYAISIGLLKNGIPELGAVLDPMTNELFSFERGKGAFLNGEVISVSSQQKLSSCFVILAAGRKAEQYAWAGRSLEKLLANTHKTKNFGSSALWLCYLAAGRIEGVVAGTFSAKDVSAAVGILNEAGGVLVDVTGEPIVIDTSTQRMYAANNEKIATQLRELLESE